MEGGKNKRHSVSGKKDTANSTPVQSAPSSGASTPVTYQHTPVNGFNSAQVAKHLNKGYQDAMDRMKNPNTPETDKVEVYKTNEKAWGKGTNTPWGGKTTAMSNGADFLSELRKVVPS